MTKTLSHAAAGYPDFPGSIKFVRMFDPADLNELQSVFDECLDACSFSRDSATAQSLGSAVIRLFSQGQRNPKAIKAILLPSFKRRA